MDVTIETADQTQKRLLQVFAAADVTWLPGDYTFTESTSLDLTDASLAEALAIVRDGDTWSVLKLAADQAVERFCIFSCHFDAGIPNSGFVGWLASEFKRTLGTGVFVVCGQNSKRGGIFDYWGLPIEMKEQATRLVATLRTSTS